MKWFRPRNNCRAALGLVVACGACLVLTMETTMGAEEETRQVTLTDKDNNTKQKMSQGCVLVVHLETQPGTAFSWVVAKSDKEQLPLLSSVVLDNPAMVPGGKAVQVFTFQGAGAGTS